MAKVFMFLLFVRPANDVPLLEEGKGTTVRKQTSSPQEIKVVSYNIRWRSGNDLKNIIKPLRNDPRSVEPRFSHYRKLIATRNAAATATRQKLIADELGLHYAWAAPPAPKPTDEEETGVAILSVYPLSDVRRIVLPHEGPSRRRRVAVGATVEIDNRLWRVYSAHAETRIRLIKSSNSSKR